MCAGASLVAAQLSAIADAVLRTPESCVDTIINLSEVCAAAAGTSTS